MDGNLDTSDVLLNRGLNGGYGFGNQGNFLGDGSAIKEGVRGNRDIQLLESVNTNASQNFLSNQIRQHNDSVHDSINTGNNFLTDRIVSQGLDFKFQSISDQLASAERLAFANAATVQREMNANQLATMSQLHAIDVKQTECCCKLEAGQASILAKLDAQALTVLAAENQKLTTQIMVNNVNAGNG